MFITKSAPLLSNKDGCDFGCFLVGWSVSFVPGGGSQDFFNDWYLARKCAFMQNEELVVECTNYQTLRNSPMECLAS